MTKDIQDLAIPSTIQDVIMARVDSLSEGAKEVIQTGSVIEREFDYELIKLATRHSEQDLLSNLSILKDAELLYERGIRPKSTFIFRHALIREVVYDSIQAGGSGVAFGRNVFQSKDPTKMVSAISKIVHKIYTVEEVLKEYKFD